MRPPGTSEQLEKRRKRALELLERGQSAGEVARRTGTTERSIRRWREEAKHPKKKSAKRPGTPSYLTPKQIKKLERELLRGAYAHGYAEDYWTLDRIGHVIWELFEVRYVPSGVWRLLTRMGWTNQRVQRLAIERNDEAIVNWKSRRLPRIKKTS
jgi:transposase